MIRLLEPGPGSKDLAKKREALELSHWESFHDRGRWHLEHSKALGGFLNLGLKILGLKKRGIRNALDLRVNELDLAFTGLPDSFDGFRMVFVSDLHLDALAGLTERLSAVLSGIKADICLLGGDFRALVSGPTHGVYLHMNRLLSSLDFPLGVVGIMGNHDFYEEALELRRMGMTFLINQALELEKNGQKIYIVGLDDTHYYDCADLRGALEKVPFDAFKLLMVHSPELLHEAGAAKIDLYLCGHTHAGQLRLPWLGALILNAKCPRKYTWGLWQKAAMWGYTSSGAGVTLVPIRFNCPPEVLVLTLRKASKKAG
ncbi:metallophosphoesterase [Dethiosulfatarculus sandiegensis]|uniref:Calcineurin-like phosphoesterase domain-containing protein n=1 Tax=Dethiosulfatarculus sandiegensis TaxID=1429043 RepID=A0A0D2I0N8_9BACT|nr:metallophosphoesterase [Dethiosulfatarculus sandiegensis]KIX16018.1 hypothetical protein X474_00180 [Dethiosulfatarculus sandiegensis]